MKKPSNKSMKIFYIILISGFLLFSLPYLFSSFLGTKTVVFFASQKGKSLSVGSMKLRWLGPQKFEQITYKDSQIDCTIDSFTTNLPIWQVLNWRTLSQETILSQNSQAHIDNANITLHIPGYPKATLEAIDLDVQTDENDKTTKIVLNGKNAEDKTPTELSLTATISNPPIIKRFQTIPIEKINASIKWDFQNISTIPFDQLLALFDKNFSGFLFDIIGSNVNIAGSMHLTNGEGPLDIGLSSPSTKIFIPAYFSKSEITLTRPLQGTFVLPRKYGRYNVSYLLKGFFSEFIPYEPISFYIANEGFSLPLNKRAFQDIQIKNGVIDLGLGKATQGSILHDLFQVLDTNLFGASQNMVDVWLSPTYFKLEKGNLYLDRTDMLLDSTYQICFWGRLDLMKEYVDITAGLTASALLNAFGIQGLSSDYVLQVPIRGPFSKPKVYTTSATKKIIAFKATDLANHPKLPFIGGILKQLMREDQSNVPPPRRPFPWERAGIRLKQPRQPQRPPQRGPQQDFFKLFR